MDRKTRSGREKIMNDVEIRRVNVDDAEDILQIYGYYVRETAVSFEYDVPTVEEFRRRIARTLRRFPYFAAIQGDRIVGYAYAGPFIDRAAYKYSAEVTIYLAANERGRGIGSRLYGSLEEALEKLGIQNLYACIGYPEVEDEYLTMDSARFHERMGYVKCGEFHKCGYKFGRWYHMIWMEKLIGRHEDLVEG